MSKSDFTDTLKYGKCCKCNNTPASKLHKCPNGDVQGSHAHDTGNGYCNCCITCKSECDVINEQLERILGNLGTEVQKEINKKILKDLQNSN